MYIYMHEPFPVCSLFRQETNWIASGCNHRIHQWRKKKPPNPHTQSYSLLLSLFSHPAKNEKYSKLREEGKNSKWGLRKTNCRGENPWKYFSLTWKKGEKKYRSFSNVHVRSSYYNRCHFAEKTSTTRKLCSSIHSIKYLISPKRNHSYKWGEERARERERERERELESWGWQGAAKIYWVGFRGLIVTKEKQECIWFYIKKMKWFN